MQEVLAKLDDKNVPAEGKVVLPIALRAIWTDEELQGLMAVMRKKGLRVGLEVGGMRWGNGFCNASAALAYAAIEQKTVARWIKLGGTIDSLTTDHAIVCVFIARDIEGELFVEVVIAIEHRHCTVGVSYGSR